MKKKSERKVKKENEIEQLKEEMKKLNFLSHMVKKEVTVKLS